MMFEQGDIGLGHYCGQEPGLDFSACHVANVQYSPPGVSAFFAEIVAGAARVGPFSEGQPKVFQLFDTLRAIPDYPAYDILSA